MSPSYRTQSPHSSSTAASSRTSTPPLDDNFNSGKMQAVHSEAMNHSRTRRRSSGQDSTASSGSYAGGAPASSVPGADIDTAELWQRMLAAQQEFHCYNSARVSAALEDDSIGAVVPSRLCLDLLNEHIALLPDHERRRVEYFIEHGDLKSSRRRSHWRR